MPSWAFMQYSIFINQIKAVEWGISTQQAILFGFLHNSASWAYSTVVDGITYYSLSKSKICTELPLLTDKPDTVYRMLKELAAKDLVLTTVIGNRTYVAITPKGATWGTSAPFEKQENKLGKKSELPIEGTEKVGELSEELGKKSERIGKKSELSNNQYQVTITSNKNINTSSLIGDVFEFWKTTMNHGKAKLDNKREKLITKALDLGYSVEDLKAAIVGCAKSEYHMGKNDNGTVYDDLGLILRDAGKIDGFIKKSTQAIPNAAYQSNNSRSGSAGLAHDDTSWADELYGIKPPASCEPDQSGVSVIEGNFSRMGYGDQRP